MLRAVEASEVDTQSEGSIEETPNFRFETSRRLCDPSVRSSTSEERPLSTRLLTNDDLDRLAARRHDGSPVADAAPAVDGVVGSASQRPDREVQPERCRHLDFEPASLAPPLSP